MKKTKRRKIATLLGIVLAVLAGLPLGINGYMLASARGETLTLQQASSLQADCILVLGAGVLADGSPSYMLTDRLTQGLELFEAGASQRLLMSGDHGRTHYDEVNAMKSWAVERGVPSSCVFMDHAGFSTYESLYRAKEVFCARRVVIVTQGYHLPRALYIARVLGLEAVGVAADLRPYAQSTNLYNTLREFAARCKDFFYALAKPKPTFLGEQIPVFGNGDATNG